MESTATAAVTSASVAKACAEGGTEAEEHGASAAASEERTRVASVVSTKIQCGETWTQQHDATYLNIQTFRRLECFIFVIINFTLVLQIGSNIFKQ